MIYLLTILSKIIKGANFALAVNRGRRVMHIEILYRAIGEVREGERARGREGERE